MENFKRTINTACMYGSITLILFGIFVFVTNYRTPKEIRVSDTVTYIEGTICQINMSFNRDVNNISRDMAKCMDAHALAIHEMLERDY